MCQIIPCGRPSMGGMIMKPNSSVLVGKEASIAQVLISINGDSPV